MKKTWLLLLVCAVLLLSSACQKKAEVAAQAAAEVAVEEAAQQIDRSGGLSRAEALELLSDFEAVDFKVTTLDGAEVTLADYRGKIVLLNLWQTWCPPCQQEMPLLEALAANNDDVVVLAVAAPLGENLDTPEQGEKAIRAFVKENKYEHMTVAFDHDLSLNSTPMYAGNGIPRSYFIDREGIARTQYPGALDDETLELIMQYMWALDNE